MSAKFRSASFKRASMCGASLLVLAAVQSASAQPSAQPASAGKPEGLEEIVVTATRRTELLKNVPMAIDAISSNELQKKQIFDVKDIAQLAPGLELENNDGRSNTATLRGIAFNPDEGTLPTVDVYFNEIEADAQTVFTSIYDLEQIEVLRGPQGLLRGSTSPAGSITIKTKTPSLTNYEGYIQATGSDQDAYNIQGALNVPIIPGMLAVRVAGLGDQNDINDVRNVTVGDSSVGHTASGRISVNFAPTDTFRSVFMYQYLRADNVQYQQVIGTGGLFPVVAGFPGTPVFAPNGPVVGVSDRVAVAPGITEFRNQTHFLTLDAILDIGDDTLELNAGYQDTILRQQRGQNTGNAPLTYESEQDIHTPYSTMSAELRYYSTGREFWNYMIGADLIRSLSPVSVTQPSDSFISGAVSGGVTFPFGGHYIQTPVDVGVFIPDQGTHYSVFGSSSFKLTDALELDVGARYQVYRTHQQSDLTIAVDGVVLPGLSNLATITPENAIQTYHAFTGGANLKYTFTPDHVGYVSYNHSFRPGATAVGVTTLLSNDLIVSQPETSDAVEIGLKSSWFDHRLNLNTDVFYQHFNGFLNVVTVNTASAGDGIIDGSPELTYNGDAESEGIETQLDAVITDGWDVGLKASWVNAQYDNAIIPCNTFTASGAAFVPNGQQVSRCLSNGRIGETPKFHLTLQSEYDYDTGTSYQPFISGLFSYQPGWHSSLVNYDYPDLPILNLYAGVRDEDAGWDFTLFVKNVFDLENIRQIAPSNNQTATSLVTFAGDIAGPGAPIDSGYRSVNVTLPREIGVTLRYNFGGGRSEPEAASTAYVPPPVQSVAPAPKSYLVFFDFNKSDLTAQAEQIVDQAATNAGPAKVTRLTVTGHTDTVGSDAYNMRLSRRRAESVAARLEKDGIPSSEIEIVAKGKRDLLVPTADGVREPQNRRVQIVYDGGPNS